MTTDTDIANAALISLGATIVEDISTDTGSPATTMNARLALAKDTVLRLRNWNSATHRVAITADADYTEVFDFSSSHILPTDPYCLRVIEVYEYKSSDWVIEGRRLLISDASIKIKYIKRITNTAEYDPLLAETIAQYLAYSTAYKITGSRQKENDAWERFNQVLAMAGTADGLEGAPPVVTSDWLEEARL